MIRRSIVAGLAAAALALSALSAAHAGTITQTTHVGTYGITLMVEGPQMMHMMGSGSGGETTVGGKNATCMYKGGMGASKGPMCNHHIEIHVTKSGKVDIHAKVSITLTNGKTHKKMVVPIMNMYGKDVRDYHYGNNIYAPSGTYTVAVIVDKVKTSFTIKL